MERRLAIFGDDNLNRLTSDINYKRLKACISALSPDIVYVIPMPGITLKLIRLIKALKIPYILVYPKAKWSKYFNKRDVKSLNRFSENACSIIYIDSDSDHSEGRDAMYVKSVPYLQSVSNLKMSLVSDDETGYMKDVLDILLQDKENYHLIVQYGRP